MTKSTGQNDDLVILSATCKDCSAGLQIMYFKSTGIRGECKRCKAVIASKLDLEDIKDITYSK